MPQSVLYDSKELTDVKKDKYRPFFCTLAMFFPLNLLVATFSPVSSRCTLITVHAQSEANTP